MNKAKAEQPVIGDRLDLKNENELFFRSSASTFKANHFIKMCCWVSQFFSGTIFREFCCNTDTNEQAKVVSAWTALCTIINHNRLPSQPPIKITTSIAICTEIDRLPSQPPIKITTSIAICTEIDRLPSQPPIKITTSIAICTEINRLPSQPPIKITIHS